MRKIPNLDVLEQQATKAALVDFMIIFFCMSQFDCTQASTAYLLQDQDNLSLEGAMPSLYRVLQFHLSVS